MGRDNQKRLEELVDTVKERNNSSGGSQSSGSTGGSDIIPSDITVPDLENISLQHSDGLPELTVRSDLKVSSDVVDEGGRHFGSSLNSKKIGFNPSDYDLGRFSIALVEYLNGLTGRSVDDLSESHVSQRVKDLPIYEEARSGSFESGLELEFPASVLNSYGVPWGVKQLLPIYLDQDVYFDSFTMFVGVSKEGGVEDFRSGLEDSLRYTSSSHAYNRLVDFVEPEFSFNGSVFLPLVGGMNVRLPGVLRRGSLPGCSLDDDPVLYMDVDWCDDYTRH